MGTAIRLFLSRRPSRYRLSPPLHKGAYDEAIHYQEGDNRADENGEIRRHAAHRVLDRKAVVHHADSFRLDVFQITPILGERQPVGFPKCVFDKFSQPFPRFR